MKIQAMPLCCQPFSLFFFIQPYFLYKYNNNNNSNNNHYPWWLGHNNVLYLRQQQNNCSFIESCQTTKPAGQPVSQPLTLFVVFGWLESRTKSYCLLIFSQKLIDRPTKLTNQTTAYQRNLKKDYGQ